MNQAPVRNKPPAPSIQLGIVNGAAASHHRGVTQGPTTTVSIRAPMGIEVASDRAQASQMRLNMATEDGDDLLDMNKKKKRKDETTLQKAIIKRKKKATMGEGNGPAKAKKTTGKENKKGKQKNGVNNKTTAKVGKNVIAVPKAVRDNVEELDPVQDGSVDSGVIVTGGTTEGGDQEARPKKTPSVGAGQNSGLAWKAKKGVTAMEPKSDDLGCEHMGVTNLFMRGRVLRERMKWYMAEGRFLCNNPCAGCRRLATDLGEKEGDPITNVSCFVCDHGCREPGSCDFWLCYTCLDDRKKTLAEKEENSGGVRRTGRARRGVDRTWTS